MLTVFADKLGLKRLATFLAVLGAVTIVSPTFWALHKECLPRKPQCMTATQECQAFAESLFITDCAVACLGQSKVTN
jgi:hypothetical protein